MKETERKTKGHTVKGRKKKRDTGGKKSIKVTDRRRGIEKVRL